LLLEQHLRTTGIAARHAMWRCAKATCAFALFHAGLVQSFSQQVFAITCLVHDKCMPEVAAVNAQIPAHSLAGCQSYSTTLGVTIHPKQQKNNAAADTDVCLPAAAYLT
jgi:hypothetical protein